MKPVLLLAAVLAASCVVGCASGPPPQKWQPRKDADLKTDLADCKKQADAVDYRSAATYNDPRYGAAAAIASRTDETDETNASIDRMYAAITYECMTNKGWKPAS